MICLEHKLSVIKHPQHTGKTYDKWLGDRAVPSHRDVLRADIDQALKQKPANMGALLDVLKTMGYEIKHGKQLSLRKAGQRRFIRLDTLGDAYSYDALSAVLAGSQKHRPKTKPIQQNELISKAIDAQRMEAKGKGYTYWAKNFNSKQYAKSILFLTENHLSIDDLPRAVEEACTKADALTAELKKGAVSKWLKLAMRGSAFFRNIFGQAKTECRKNGTQGIIFIRNSKWNEL